MSGDGESLEMETSGGASLIVISWPDKDIEYGLLLLLVVVDEKCLSCSISLTSALDMDEFERAFDSPKLDSGCSSRTSNITEALGIIPSGHSGSLDKIMGFNKETRKFSPLNAR